jgi:hypothetical protein
MRLRILAGGLVLSAIETLAPATFLIFSVAVDTVVATGQAV